MDLTDIKPKDDFKSLKKKKKLFKVVLQIVGILLSTAFITLWIDYLIHLFSKLWN